MGRQIDLYTKWKRAKKRLSEIFETPEHSLVIHYSCESFYDRENNPKSPRITSIAVRNLESGQTNSFSIHLIAERRNLLDNINNHYDELEKEMLENFFTSVRAKHHCRWIHWNMRDANYGFEALENRLKALNGNPEIISDDKKYDLARILISIYGIQYASHPRMDNLMKQNKITTLGWLSGAEEAAAFENKEFLKLHQSTLRKVDVLANIASRAHAEDLKTKSPWFEVHGRSIKAILEWLREHWLVGSVLMLLGVAASIDRALPNVIDLCKEIYAYIF